MKKTIILLVLMISSLGFSQNDEAFVDALVAQKMAELEMQGNPEYFYRKDYCDGNILMFTMPNGELCTSKSTYYSVYVFWKDGKTMKIQKFDNCGSYKTIIVAPDKNITKILREKQALEEGEVKPYQGRKVDTNAFDNMTVQSCHKVFKFVLEGAVIEKSFNEFDLTNDSKYANVNAKHNNALPLVALDAEVSKLLKSLEERGRFFREN